ncbi:MAG: hypothetical protein K8M05_25065 [Deltaproteobacteria bacterium]|nr:hypothetical protein [Kofleriaceae bacterium]
MPTYSYRVVRIRQTDAGNWLILFGAPATDIDSWAGVPRKKEQSEQSDEDTAETTGFQREINAGRLKSLLEFYRNPNNTIQNPLLCATRETSRGSVEFAADGGASGDRVETGTITITIEDLDSKPLVDLLRHVKADLEARVPALAQHPVSPTKVKELKQRARIAHPVEPEEEADPDDIDGESNEDAAPESEQNVTAVVFSDESHILEFWEDVAARIQVLEEAGATLAEVDNFEGYTKEAMISFLRPLVVVDGQHRLRGAIDAAKSQAMEEPFRSEIENAVLAGKDPSVVQREVERRAARILPVSLIMTDDPAEHVFQFVVVNQKATPIGRALLGTIVSTSLSNEELSRVSARLTRAGIPLDESRSIAYLSRNPDSPFFNLVERGLSSDKKGLLPWSVLGSLVAIFQELRGGKLFHEKNDYADKWRRHHLEHCPLVAGAEKPYAAWSAPDGPWRDVFVAFWTAIRNRLANMTDVEAKNYWGAGRESQIFNKISLTILASDFFQYLCDKDAAISSATEVKELVADWLDGVDPTYFSRDWKLSGVKKDSPGIRHQWSRLWLEYRKDPRRLPHTKSYSQPAKVD